MQGFPKHILDLQRCSQRESLIGTVPLLPEWGDPSCRAQWDQGSPPKEHGGLLKPCCSALPLSEEGRMADACRLCSHTSGATQTLAKASPGCWNPPKVRRWVQKQQQAQLGNAVQEGGHTESIFPTQREAQRGSFVSLNFVLRSQMTAEVQQQAWNAIRASVP